MKRVDLMKELHRVARDKSVTCQLVRQGSGHEIWQVGASKVSVPHHKEINERTAQSILDHAKEG